MEIEPCVTDFGLKEAYALRVAFSLDSFFQRLAQQFGADARVSARRRYRPGRPDPRAGRIDPPDLNTGMFLSGSTVCHCHDVLLYRSNSGNRASSPALLVSSGVI